MSAAVSAAREHNVSIDFAELSVSNRPSDLGSLEDDRSCNQRGVGDYVLNRRPNNLDETSSISSMSQNNDLCLDDDSDPESSQNGISKHLMSEKRGAATSSFTNPPFFISTPPRRSSVDLGEDFMGNSDSSMLRKRLDEIPEYFSAPPHKRSKHQSERRRGRPRKEEISENEDLRTVAKRMYARAYRENMKSKFVEVELQLDDLRKEHAVLKASHKKLESLVEQCNFCSSSWALVKNMNIDPVVLKMAYDTLTNIKTPTDSPHSSKTHSQLNSRSPSMDS